MDKNQFFENLKVNQDDLKQKPSKIKKTATGITLALAMAASIVGCNSAKDNKGEATTETQLATEQSKDINKDSMKRNHILIQYKKELEELKNEIEQGHAEDIDFQNKMIRGVQLLTALSNGFDIGIDTDESQYIIPEFNSEKITGYKINIEEIPIEGVTLEEYAEYERKINLEGGILDPDAANIYNDYVTEILKTDYQKILAIKRMRDKVNEYIKEPTKESDLSMLGLSEQDIVDLVKSSYIVKHNKDVEEGISNEGTVEYSTLDDIEMYYSPEKNTITVKSESNENDVKMSQQYEATLNGDEEEKNTCVEYGECLKYYYDNIEPIVENAETENSDEYKEEMLELEMILQDVNYQNEVYTEEINEILETREVEIEKDAER